MSAALLAQLECIVGTAGIKTSSDDTAAYLTDWRGNFTGRAQAIVLPTNTEQVAAVVRLCAETNTPIVPQGGNTGLVGGGIPDETGSAIVLSLTQMNRVRTLDLANNAITVEAGCILQNVQLAADAAGKFFPLSLAAEGSCTIGGNLATNAGGTAVLRYGNARDLVLGIEAVLPDGRIWNGLKALRKDNTGYDLKHLLMGAEGTLGIITAAVLKLYPKPKTHCTALVAIASACDAIALLGLVQSALGDRLTGFELMSRHCLDTVIKQFPSAIEPFAQRHPWQVLIGLTDTQADAALEDALAQTLAPLFESGFALDAVIARSETQAKSLWQLREWIPEAEKLTGRSVKHDISVPISHIAEFIERCDPRLQAAFPTARIVCFGHLGDGNLHYNLSFPDATPSAEQSRTANNIVYALLDELNGSISAEHGLGQLKREEITRHKSVVELDLMRAIKRALDPQNIMNPGKVL